MKVETVELSKISEDPSNARKHDKKNLAAITASLEKFGQQKPIVVDVRGVIIAGNGTYQAAKKLKWKTIEIVRTKLDGVNARAYALADNRSGELSAWDDDLLTQALSDLGKIDFDIGSIGFDEKFVEGYVRNPGAKGHIEDDAVPEVPKNVHGVKRGQVYKLGEHRLMCGDSTDEVEVGILMAGKKADMVFTDPPYNVDYSNADRPKPGKIDHGKIKNDVMDVNSFTSFLDKAFANLVKFTKDDSSMYIWYASKMSLPFISAIEKQGVQVNQQVIWKKPMLLGRSKYQWAHEPCLFVVKGSPFFTSDRTKTTVWDFGGYDKSSNVHPTQKPTVLPLEGLGNSSKVNDSVLDLFGGSGSTLIACEKTKRKCFMMELDEHYCSVIIERWQQFTKQKATLVSG